MHTAVTYLPSFLWTGRMSAEIPLINQTVKSMYAMPLNHVTPYTTKRIHEHGVGSINLQFELTYVCPDVRMCGLKLVLVTQKLHGCGDVVNRVHRGQREP